MMIKKNCARKSVRLSMVVLVLGTLGGCAAMDTAMDHHSLEVQSKMSDTIFLDPVSSGKKTIYVQVHNTSGENLSLKSSIEQQLRADGWKVVTDVEKAHDMLQVNVLQAGKAKDPDAVWTSISGGYGSVLAAGGLAGLAAGYNNHSVGTGLAIGGAVGVASWLADHLVRNVTYSVITDVQVSTRTNGKVNQSTQTNLSQGNSTHVSQSYQQETNWMRYRTRIASVADKMNLKFPEAAPVLANKMSSEISGIFTG